MRASQFVDTAPETQAAPERPKVIRPSKLGLYLAQTSNALPTIDRVAARFGCTRDDLVSRKRTDRLANARQVAMWVLRQQGMTLDEIGQVFDGRDNSTIVYSVSKIDVERRMDPGVATELDRLVER